jgi:NADPH:quinone reductase-like Zn-dependent oxidoreductase
VKAVAYSRYGGPEVLELVDLPTPKFGQNGVLVRVEAAVVNPADLALQAGLADPIMEAVFPVVPGWDVAGVVEEVGDGVTELSPGDEVLGYLRQDILHTGTYAEQVAADVELLVKRPSNWGPTASAALPLAGLTALQAVSRIAPVPGVTMVYARQSKRDLLELVDLAEAGALNVRVGPSFSLADAARAQESVSSGHSSGKVSLLPW